MRRFSQVGVASSVSLLAAAGIVVGWSGCLRPPAQEAGASAPALGGASIKQGNLGAFVRGMEPKLPGLLSEAGVPAQLVESLVAEASATISDSLGGDFDRYQARRIAAGARLGAVADELLTALRRSRYRHVEESTWGGDTTRQFSYAWSNPRPRGMGISNIEPDSVQCGLGLTTIAGRGGWRFSNYSGQFSLFEPVGGRLKASEADALEARKHAAWILMRAQLEDGRSIDLKYVFVYNGKQWEPLLIMVGGEEGAVPQPLL